MQINLAVHCLPPLLLERYALGLQLSPLQALAAGLTLFALCALVSRWWLTRFRFGPLEWLWRSITYGRLQPLRQGSRFARGGDPPPSGLAGSRS